MCRICTARNVILRYYSTGLTSQSYAGYNIIVSYIKVKGVEL
jgi:hypothetical protein